MPQETTPLLPPPAGARRKSPKRVLSYALLLLLGAGLGAGAVLGWQHRPKGEDKGPMVPPIYKLPPVSCCIAPPWLASSDTSPPASPATPHTSSGRGARPSRQRT